MNSRFRTGIVLGVVVMLCTGLRPAADALPPLDLCEIFGYVYLETEGGPADYTYYVEESEFSAHYVVFWEENPLYASESGHWYATDDLYEAHYVLKEVKSRDRADFIVYFTEYDYRAGCP